MQRRIDSLEQFGKSLKVVLCKKREDELLKSRVKALHFTLVKGFRSKRRVLILLFFFSQHRFFFPSHNTHSANDDFITKKKKKKKKKCHAIMYAWHFSE